MSGSGIFKLKDKGVDCMINVGTKVGVRFIDDSGKRTVVRGKYNGHTVNKNNKEVFVVKDTSGKLVEVEISRIEAIVPL